MFTNSVTHLIVAAPISAMHTHVPQLALEGAGAALTTPMTSRDKTKIVLMMKDQ